MHECEDDIDQQDDDNQDCDEDEQFEFFKLKTSEPDHGASLPEHFHLQLSNKAKDAWRVMSSKDRQLIHEEQIER